MANPRAAPAMHRATWSALRGALLSRSPRSPIVRMSDSQRCLRRHSTTSPCAAGTARPDSGQPLGARVVSRSAAAPTRRATRGENAAPPARRTRVGKRSDLVCQGRSRHEPNSPHSGCRAREHCDGVRPECGPGAGGRHPRRGHARHVVAYIKRYGVVLGTSRLDLECSGSGRSRWKCFVYANGGLCTGTLSEVYSTRAHAYRAT